MHFLGVRVVGAHPWLWARDSKTTPQRVRTRIKHIRYGGPREAVCDTYTHTQVNRGQRHTRRPEYYSSQPTHSRTAWYSRLRSRKKSFLTNAIRECVTYPPGRSKTRSQHSVSLQSCLFKTDLKNKLEPCMWCKTVKRVTPT